MGLSPTDRQTARFFISVHSLLCSLLAHRFQIQFPSTPILLSAKYASSRVIVLLVTQTQALSRGLSLENIKTYLSHHRKYSTLSRGAGAHKQEKQVCLHPQPVAMEREDQSRWWVGRRLLMLVVVCCCVFFCPCSRQVSVVCQVCRVQHPTRPNPSADFAPILWQELMLTHEVQGRVTHLHDLVVCHR